MSMNFQNSYCLWEKLDPKDKYTLSGSGNNKYKQKEN